MSHAGVRKLEISEAEETITLASLRKLANALNCELKYALVPRTSLDNILTQRARQVAQDRHGPVAHSMALEDQSTDAAMSAVQLDLLTKEILAGSKRGLW
jgi:predicted DNA-binding mobile mystery protein A